MDCEKISLALIYLWIGESNDAKDIAKNCIETLRDSITDIREKIKEVKIKVEDEYLLPYYLRNEGINSDDLVKLGLYELARRIQLFSGDLKSKEYNSIKYSIINNGYKVVIKGFCKDCNGYKFKELKNGFIVQLDGLIYGEVIGNIREEDLIKEIKSL
ncbi:hypothetical protein [Sulfurisphaera tokodaii]|nr:hypothetical protein [Sulfurisphaera tokodaii]